MDLYLADRIVHSVGVDGVGEVEGGNLLGEQTLEFDVTGPPFGLVRNTACLFQHFADLPVVPPTVVLSSIDLSLIP